MKIILVIVLNLFVIGFCIHVKRLRIIGGHTENIERYPFIIAIVVKDLPGTTGYGFAGGAAIISSFWAITAAHCISDLMKEYVPQGSVILRGNSTSWRGSHSQFSSDHVVEMGFIHDKYSLSTDDYDVATLKVKKKFCGKYEIPVSMLASASYKYLTGTPAVVLGWGTTYASNSAVDAFTVPNLRAVEIKIVDFKQCVNSYRYINEIITPRMLCASAPGKDACINDSGGPLVQNNTLIGLVSWGIGCANDGFPGIYTRISTVSDWIKKISEDG